MFVSLPHDRKQSTWYIFLEKDNWKKFHRSSHVAICTFFFSSMVTLKIHSTLPIRERRRGRSLHLIALCVPPKKESAWENGRQAFRCCLNKDMEMWGESSIWRFSNRGTQAARCFCCRRSEKLFPVIFHLVTSRTNILLLLAPAVVVVVVVFPLQTDGTRALIVLPPQI